MQKSFLNIPVICQPGNCVPDLAFTLILEVIMPYRSKIFILIPRAIESFFINFLRVFRQDVLNAIGKFLFGA
jgi:hypothetical protein